MVSARWVRVEIGEENAASTFRWTSISGHARGQKNGFLCGLCVSAVVNGEW
jgi:hypothetical protein